MPLFRRIPKRGFNNARHTVRYIPVNVESLEIFEDGAIVDVEMLRSVGLAKGPVKRIRILGDGDLSKKLLVSAHSFSVTAKAKIEKAGGKCSLIAKLPVEEAKS
jgi:large subunit ribosomal protein L15